MNQAGSVISVALADYVTTCISKCIEREHLKLLRRKVKHLAKSSRLVTLQVDPVIWRAFDRFQRSRDVNMPTSQEILVSGLQLVVRTCMKEKLLLLL